MTGKQLSLFSNPTDSPSPDNSTVDQIPTSLRHESDNFQFHLLRGNILKQRGFTIPAKNNYKKALQLAPDEPAPAWHLGIMAYDDGHLYKAKYWLLKAIGKLEHSYGNNHNRPNHQQLSLRKVFAFFTGITCIRLGDPDRGYFHLQDAIEPGFEGSYAAIEKATALFDLGRVEEAVNFLKSEIKRRDPETFARLQRMTEMKNIENIPEKR